MTEIAIVSIYHAHDAFREHEFGSPIDLAYSYEVDSESDGVQPERIFRANNAVDGWEENIKAKARSLSVGDVVAVGYNDKPASIFTIDRFGTSKLEERDLEASLKAGCPGCPICNSLSNY